MILTVLITRRTLTLWLPMASLTRTILPPENRHALIDDIEAALDLLLDAVTDHGIEIKDEWVAQFG